MMREFTEMREYGGIEGRHEDVAHTEEVLSVRLPLVDPYRPEGRKKLEAAQQQQLTHGLD